MGNYVGNAKSQVDVYRVKYDGTNCSILQGITGDTAATTIAHKAIRLALLEDAAIAYQEDGTVKITPKNFQDNKALNDFLNAVAKPKAASATRPERYDQKGTKYGGAASGEYVLVVYYGGEDADDGIKMTVAFGNVSATSGSHTDKKDEWTDPTIEFVGSKAPADVTIAAGLFDATILDATDVATKIPKIAKDTSWVREFVTKAS